MNDASRIAILIGSGALGAREEVAQIADLLAAPVAKALLGKDVLPDDHPHVTGSIGVIGTKPTSDAMERCDAILMIGTSFPYVRYLPATDGSVRGVQIDLNPERIGIRFPVEVGLVGDSKATLAALMPLLQRKSDRRFLEEIQESIREWSEMVERHRADTSLPLRPPRLAHALGGALADDAVVICDSGTTAMWAARDLGIRGNQRFTVSGLLASMACALPYSIGIQTAYPDRQVVAFVGDGGLSMLPGDLATLVKYNLPVKVIVLKNNVLGMIRWEQLMWVGNPEYGIELQDIDFAALAGAVGLRAVRAERSDDIAEVIAGALGTPGPVLVEAVVDPYEPMLDGSVKPMQAEHVAQALTGGEVNVERITRSIYQYAQEDVPQNREVLVQTLRTKAGELVERAESADSGGPEPQSTFESQAGTAPERTSGSKARR